MKKVLNIEEVGNIIPSAKQLAKNYRNLTGRPLGLTGEIAEYEAAQLLGLELAEVRQAGFDAISNDAKKFRLKVVAFYLRNQDNASVRLSLIWTGTGLFWFYWTQILSPSRFIELGDVR